MEAREYIKGLMKEAGLIIREDVMGNTFGEWEGSDPKAGVYPIDDMNTALSSMIWDPIALCT